MNSNINYLIPESVVAGIYKITAPDGHFYIGSSNNIRNRIKRHFNYLSRNLKLKENREWQFRYNANPDWIWKCELIEEVLFEGDLLSVEQKYLDIYYESPLCMNVNSFANKPPSQKGVPKTEKWKNEMKKRVPWNKNKKCPAISAALSNRTWDDIYGLERAAQRKEEQKIRLLNKPNIMKNRSNPAVSVALKGRKQTPEHIANKISSRLGMKYKIKKRIE